MPDLLTLAEFRKRVESAMEDDPLTDMMDAAEAEIIRRLGPLASQVELFRRPETDILFLSRRATAVDTVSERRSETLTTALAADDYELLADGWQLRRLANGTNGNDRWRGEVTVTYTPVDTEAERKGLMVNLVKIELQYCGFLAVSVGMKTQKISDPEQARAALFRPFMSAGRSLIS